MIGFVYHYDFEFLLCALIDLLGLGYFFEEVLDNYTVIVSDV
jgi:hypothetical protein